MNKPIIFVSHAATDSKIAGVFKTDIERNFLGMCQLFVSSDLDSIQGGSEWIQNIKTNLSKAVMSIGLYSPTALERPWIYTEFGAGWIRDIPTISVCHTGLRKDALPVPLSHFQALDLIDELHLEHLYQKISQAVNCQLPPINYSEEVKKYKEITENQRVKRSSSAWIEQIGQWNPEFKKLFTGANQVDEILIPSNFEAQFFTYKNESEALGFLAFDSKGMAMGTRVGAQATVWSVRKGQHFDELAKHLNS